MEPDTLLQTVHDDLAPWVRARRGLLSVAADPYQFLEVLAEAPQGWRAVLHWAGDESGGSHPLEGAFVDHELHLGISANPGLTIAADVALFGPRAGNTPAILRLVALARAHVRGLVLRTPEEDTEQYLHYRGCAPVVMPEGIPLRAYRLRFTVTAALTPVAYRY
ncbi:hypothetical protein ASA1KI_21250 [Opitutales bacterium ASA1]|uniref:hypothetical protein n=1 Tax=Congregicoccus parvus TaxID=3081749 RepID=UPI002B2C70BF|nr:hypothetical protein ASA1KI_21250 [Opitutales bacterium ASA1]